MVDGSSKKVAVHAKGSLDLMASLGKLKVPLT